MRLLHIDHDKRRVYICGRRLHHGLVGLGAAAIGAALMLPAALPRSLMMRSPRHKAVNDSQNESFRQAAVETRSLREGGRLRSEGVGVR